MLLRLLFLAALPLVPLGPLPKQPPAPPLDPIAAWDWLPAKKGEHWYARTLAPATHADAEGQALLAGGHLVTIETRSEADFLVEAFGQPGLDAVWIGLRRRAALEPFAWTSGVQRVTSQWAAGHNPALGEPVPAGVSLAMDGDDAGDWLQERAPGLALFGIIELDFDPRVDPLVAEKRTEVKRLAAWYAARETCLSAADVDAERLDLASSFEELQELRRAKARIIHATPRPSPTETQQASDAVQAWVDARLALWRKESQGLRAGLAALAKANRGLAKSDRLALSERALFTDILCAILDREAGARDLETRLQNQRTAARTQLPDPQFAIVADTNEHRQLMGVARLLLDSRITYAAQVHADDMAALGFFEHESPVPGRRHFSDRQAEAGYHGGGGENLYQGGDPGASSVLGWISSPGHHSNMLQPSHGLIGPGISAGYGVEVFGSPPCWVEPGPGIRPSRPRST
ncbi:MAG: CAP domain-containing protein [Planctomycetota bacterium]|nr:CAP domain-containing protein [Planctomycetota bacterium]